MGCYRSYQTIKIGGFFNFAMKFLVAIFFAIVLFGCDGNECRNEYNNKAFSIITDNLIRKIEIGRAGLLTTMNTS